MKNDNNNFQFYIPAEIEKASNSQGGEIMKFKGIASTSEQDSQGEFLDPTGFDLTSFKYVNWNHLGSKDSATIIGEPTKASINEKKELYVEGVLFPEVAMARSTWALMKALQNSQSGNKLGISVEGKALERGCGPQFLDKEQKIVNPNFSKEKWNKITKARITSIALCPTPINGNTWAGIMKGEMNDSDIEEEYDEETKKAMTAEGGEGVTSKESVETKGNKKPLKSLEGNPENSFVALRKGEVFERIFHKFPGITIEKAKSVYTLISKTANIMNKDKTTPEEISDETISKALDILALASDDITKAADMKKTDSDSEEDEDEKEMVQKAHSIYKAMCAENKEKESIKASLVKKGYGEKVIEKAMSLESDPKKDSLYKSEVSELLKSHNNNLANIIGEKFSAIGTILKKVTEDNNELKKSLEDTLLKNDELNGKIETILKTSPGARSIISKSYSSRFNEDKAEGGAAIKKFNVNSSIDRVALRDKVTELSGIHKSENYDKGLVDIAQQLEIAKSLDTQSIQRLAAMDILVVSE